MLKQSYQKPAEEIRFAREGSLIPLNGDLYKDACREILEGFVSNGKQEKANNLMVLEAYKCYRSFHSEIIRKVLFGEGLVKSLLGIEEKDILK